MSKEKIKQLLYFTKQEEATFYSDGFPVSFWHFKDVRTGDKVVLNTCMFKDSVPGLSDKLFYWDIRESSEDYDILWDRRREEEIRPLKLDFLTIREEFQRMSNEGVSPNAINYAMLDFADTIITQKEKVKS